MQELPVPSWRVYAGPFGATGPRHTRNRALEGPPLHRGTQGNARG